MGGIEGNGWGAPKIGWTALKHWSELTRTELEAWEASAIVNLGTTYANINNDKAMKASKGKTK